MDVGVDDETVSACRRRRREGSRLAFELVAAGAIVFAASLLSIRSSTLSGGTLVLWPADGLTLGLMLRPATRRPWMVLAGGLAGALGAFAVVGRYMLLAESRVGMMALAIPLLYVTIRRLVHGRSIAEIRVLLAFVGACAVVSTAAAFARSLALEVFWGYPGGPLTLTTAAATFAGDAVVTPLILLLSNPSESQSSSLSSKAVMWGVVALYITAVTGAFLETRYPTAYLVPLALILVAHFVDFVGIVVVISATAFICVALTVTGHGAISHFQGSMREKVLLTQGFLAVIICATLPFSALMTERDRLRRSLLAALAEAREASKVKSSFLATITHEIRTPLNGVLGMAQVIEMDELTPVQRQRLSVVRSSGETLLRLLNDMLDLSKIEAGQMTLETSKFDPAKVISAVAVQNQVLATHKGLTLDCDVGELQGFYEGDPHRVRQIVQNLVSNAIKFTETGGVSVHAQSVANGLLVTVSDTGVGVPEDRVGELFQKFRQVDDSATRRIGGTGLGLSICRELARAMGGEVSVRSVFHQGSTFTLFLPLPQALGAADEDEPHAGAIEPLELEVRVLAAEDNETNRLVLRTLLEAAGVEPTLVCDGAEALAAWRAGSYDVILMDVQMPVMDGLTAAKAIRAAEAQEGLSHTPIVALTANAMDHQVREYFDVGMDDYLAKPISVQKLFSLLVAVQAAKDRGAMAGPGASDLGPVSGETETGARTKVFPPAAG